MSVFLNFFFVLAHAQDQLELGLSFHHYSTQNDTLVQTLLYEHKASEHFAFQGGARMSESVATLESWDYKAEALARVSFFEFGARISQNNLHAVEASSTKLLLRSKVEFSPFSFLGLIFQIGWYERWLYLSGVAGVVQFRSDGAHDHDLATSFGFYLRPIPQVIFEALAGTIEPIDVYQLNNPFLQARLQLNTHDSFTLSLFSRYRLLLGFGRLDEFASGVSVAFSLK